MSIWDELDLGELKPERVKISMADGRVTIPSGSKEDELIKIGEHYVPVDFMVADVKVDPEAPILLGRPFLATVGAIIDTRRGRMTFDIGGDTFDYAMEKGNRAS